METTCLAHYASPYSISGSDFEEAYYSARLRYSLRHLSLIENISEALILEALQKAFKACLLLGVNSTHHFKKIFVFDATTETIYTDWLMSRNGFNLMVMQIPSQNEKLAQCLWELAAPES